MLVAQFLKNGHQKVLLLLILCLFLGLSMRLLRLLPRLLIHRLLQHVRINILHIISVILDRVLLRLPTLHLRLRLAFIRFNLHMTLDLLLHDFLLLLLICILLTPISLPRICCLSRPSEQLFPRVQLLSGCDLAWLVVVEYINSVLLHVHLGLRHLFLARQRSLARIHFILLHHLLDHTLPTMVICKQQLSLLLAHILLHMEFTAPVDQSIIPSFILLNSLGSDLLLSVDEPVFVAEWVEPQLPTAPVHEL